MKKIKPSNTIQFVKITKDKEFRVIKEHSIHETRTINDISWALINGRSYNLLAIASDVGVKIFEIILSDSYKEIDVLP